MNKDQIHRLGKSVKACVRGFNAFTAAWLSETLQSMTSNDFTIKIAILKPAQSKAFLTYTTAIADPIFSGKT